MASQIGSSAELKALSTISKQIDNFQKKLCCDAAEPAAGSSCGAPLFVEVCNQPPGVDQELIFTNAVPICVDNGDGTFSTWYTRESIVWDSVTSTIVSRTTEYSNDGATWSTTGPSSPFTVGSCETPLVDCELIITDPLPICVEVTPQVGDLCNGGTPAIKEQWYVREKITWDSINCTETNKVIEYSSDGINWSTTAPASYTLGQCPLPVVEEVKQPEICEAFGDDLSTLCAGHNFSITKPSCCKIKVTTDIGSFHVLDNIQFYNTSDFKCLVTVISVDIVSGNCTLDSIHIISNRLN
jgi:hypothetical protein